MTSGRLHPARTARTAARPVTPAPRRVLVSARVGRFGLRAGCAILAAQVAFQLHRYWNSCMHDDAFISFRYARNLVRGEGLVMNAGERVEGFTNFLWTLLAGSALRLGMDPLQAAQLVGAVLALALVVSTFVFTERRLGNGWFALVTPAYLSFNLAYVMAALSGLETLLFSALVFATYAAFVEERRNGARRRGLWAALCAIATLVRPEGALLFALLGSWCAVGILRGEPASRLLRAAALYAMLLAPLVLWRLAYYGVPFPNTFYAKVGYTTAQLARGWRFMYHTVGWTLTPWLLAAAATLTLVAFATRVRVPSVPQPVAGWTRLFAARPRDESLAVALLLCVGYFVYLWLVGGDYEPTARFYVPVFALLVLLFQEGLRTFVLLFQDGGRWLRAAVALIALGAGVGCVWQSEQRFSRVLHARGWPEGRRQHHAQLRAAGEYLHGSTPTGSCIALSSIGALSYFADRPILDMMGLTDRHIGHRKVPDMGKGPAGHEKGDGAYVLARKPEIILMDKGQMFPDEVDRDKVLAGARGISELEIARSAAFARDYALERAATTAGVLHYFALRR